MKTNKEKITPEQWDIFVDDLLFIHGYYLFVDNFNIELAKNPNLKIREIFDNIEEDIEKVVKKYFKIEQKINFELCAADLGRARYIYHLLLYNFFKEPYDSMIEMRKEFDAEVDASRLKIVR